MIRTAVFAAVEQLEFRRLLSASMVADIYPGSGSSIPVGGINVNGTLFFAATSPTSWTELWRSDGTTAGTVLVKDVNPGTAGSFPLNLTNVNGTVFFTANDGSHGTELWKTNGTAAGTVLVKDINPGSGSSNPLNVTAVNNTLFFEANDGVHGTELWKSDGTAAGTIMVKDILAGAASSNPINLVALNNGVFFQATDGVHGTELWKSDGTAAGTVMVADIMAGGGSSFPLNLTACNGLVFFQATDTAHGTELWRTNGTTAGTVLVKDIDPGAAGSFPLGLTAVNNVVYFAANDGKAGTELWKSDGTSAGTALVKDINAGPGSSLPLDLTNANGVLYFAATTPGAGTELWKSDGTPAGTVLVKDINPGAASSLPLALTSAGGLVYFAATDGIHGDELWQGDGTGAGTVMVQDINPGPAGSYPLSITPVGHNLFFDALDPAHGVELWKLFINTAPTVEAAPVYKIAEGQSLTLSSSGSDADGDPLTYAWDVNGDGVFGDATGSSPTLSWPQLQALGITGGPRTFNNVRVQVSDGFGGVTTSVPATLTVVDTPPTIALSGDSAIVIGTPFHLTLGAVTDPGNETVSLYTVHWGDGLSNIYPSNGPVTHTYLAPPSSAVIVDLTDQNGLHPAAGMLAIGNVTVNHAPTFLAGPDQSVIQDAGPQVVSLWATHIGPGSPLEIGQTLTFIVTGGTNANLFSSPPAISPDGTLSYTSAPGAYGSAQITLVLMDNGGTALGGQDTSAPQTFTITILPSNHPPVLVLPPTNLIAAPNQTLSFTATASDVDAGQTLSFDLVDAPGGAAIDPSSGAFTWMPTNVQGNQSYTFEVRVTDNGSPPLSDAVPVTISVGASRYSVWNDQVVPAVPAINDPNAVELGVKFQSDVAGTITGVRFYKGPGNVGTHVGNLWDDQGNLLATATFANETDSGWQEVDFATPVPIQAHTTYVASYFAPDGNYAIQTKAFAAAGIDAAPIHLLQDGTDGGNGVFQYSPVTIFPGNTFSSANYYVDVVFSTNSDVFEQTTASDFASGTLDGVQINDAAGGEISLAQEFDDFTGTSLGTDWTSSSWASLNGGQTPEADVSGGILSVAGALVLSSNSTGANPVEGSVSFPAAPFEHFGLATGFDNASSNAWAVFSTFNTTDTLFARVNDFGVEQDVNLGPLPVGFHDYRVQPVAGGFQFSVDGAVVTTIAANIPSDVLKAAAISGFNGSPTPPLQVDWVRFGDYASTGTYTSKVFDAGQVVNWGQISWTASIPAGSSITVEVSTGDTATPDASWSDWTAVTDGSQLNNLPSRYIRYRIIINSTDPLGSAVINDVLITSV